MADEKNDTTEPSILSMRVQVERGSREKSNDYYLTGFIEKESDLQCLLPTPRSHCPKQIKIY